MATASVLQYPDFAITYTDPTSYNIYDNVVAKTISAYRDESGLAQSLTVGATSNLVLEGVSGVQIYVGSGNEGIEFYTSSYSNFTRTDTRILDINTESNVTLISATNQSNTLKVASGDQQNTVQVSSVIVTQCNNTAYLSTDQIGGIYIDEPVRITQNMFVNGTCEAWDIQIDNNAVVAGDVTSYGSVFGQHLNVWRQANSNTIGYSFRINDQEQLELVKYARDYGVYKKVMVFGTMVVGSNDLSDTHPITSSVSGIGTINLDGSGVTAPSVWLQSPAGSLYVSSNVSVGIGIENPAYPLEVLGSFSATDVYANTLSVSELYTTSDIRLKTIVQNTVSESVLQKINDLGVVRFKFNEDPADFVRTGLIAQDVAYLFPDAIHSRKVGSLDDCLCIDNSVMIAYLLRAVQELYKLCST